MSRRRSRRSAAGAVGTRPVGQPVLLVAGGSEQGATFPVPAGTSYVGRGADNDLVLSSSQVSRRHARLARAHGTVTIEDLGSTNGTWLAGRRVETPVPLRPGDVVRLGDVHLRLLLPSEATGRPARIPVGAGTAADAVTVPAQRAAPEQEEVPEQRPAAQRREAAAGRPTGARKAWWTELPGKVKAVILTAGALAAAISAVLALWPKPGPPPGADVRAVQLVSPRMPLSAYTLGYQRVAFTMIPPPEQETRLAPTGPPTTPSTPSGTSPSTQTPSIASSAPESPLTSEGASESTSVSSTASGPSSEASFPIVTAAPVVPRIGTGDVRQIMNIAGPLVDQALPDIHFPLAAQAAQVPGTLPYQIAKQAAAGPRNTVVPPRQAARRIVAFLRDVQTARVPTNDGARTEPVGAVLSVRLQASGLRGRAVLVDWQLSRPGSPIPAYGGWLHRLVALELHPDTDPFNQVVFLWIPLPRQRGPYVVSVTVSSGGRPFDTGQTLPFS